jgi:hypothetical protein
LFGKTANEAISSYVGIHQQAVQCITNDVLRAGTYPSSEPSLSLVLARGEVVSLTGGLPHLGLQMRQFYRLVDDREMPSRRRWSVLVTGYFYTFVLRNTGRELLAFHWHPYVIAKAFPHVHLESGLELRSDLAGLHVPTGPLALEDIIRFAIEELGIRPRVRHWAAVLDRTRAAHVEAGKPDRGLTSRRSTVPHRP